MSDGPQLIPDRASVGDDPFGIGDLAERISEVIVAAPTPFSVSISGAWGVGKTTLIEEVRERFGRRWMSVLDLWSEDVSLLRWRIAVELRALLSDAPDEAALDEARSAAAKELDRLARESTSVPGARARAGGVVAFLRDLGLRGILIAFGFIGLLYLIADRLAQEESPYADMATAILGSVITAVIVAAGFTVSVRESSTTMAPANERQTLLNEVHRLLQAKPEHPIALVVDNIDRLAGREAFDVLGEIRSFIDVRTGNCVFLIPLDREAFVRSVAEVVGSRRAARDYLEKFFSVDMLLTRPAALDVREWARALLRGEFGGRPEAELSLAAEVIGRASTGSPRTVKRMVNDITVRHHLIDPEVRGTFTLPQLTLVEAIVTRFPYAAVRIADDPRRLTDARGRLQMDMGGQARVNALGDLLERGDGEEGDHGSVGERNVSLLDLLVFAAEIPLSPETVQTILSARDDRDWRDVANAGSIKSALDHGDAVALREALAPLSDDERQLALDRAIHRTRKDRDNGFRTSAIFDVNALAGVGDASVQDGIRTIALEAVRDPGTGTEPVRLLSPAAVDLIFDPAVADGRIDRLARETAMSLAADPTVAPLAPLVRAIARTHDKLDESTLGSAREALARVPVIELSPLFEPRPVAQLLEGPVVGALASNLTGWTEERDADEIARLCSWLDMAIAEGIVDASELRPIASQVGSRIPSIEDLAEGGLRSMVTLLGRTAPSPETDVVAAALATGKGDSVLGLRLAIRLPLSAGADAPVTSAVAAFLANESADRIHELVDDSDEEIRALMDIATPLTARWFATDDRSFLEMAVANRDHRSWTPAADGLPGLGGTRVVRFVREAGDVASSTGAPKEGVDKVSDAFGSVIRGSASVRGLTGTQLRGAGQALLALAEAGGDVDGPISEIQSSVSSMQPGEAVEWTGLVEEVVEHLPATTGDLVPKLIERCLVNREIDLARVRWLLRHGADRTDTLDAVVHEVGSHSPTAETVELLRPLRAPLKRKWQAREALVLRASQDPHSTDTPLLLEEAREWSQVPRTKRSDYDSALDALVVNPALNPVLSELAR